MGGNFPGESFPDTLFDKDIRTIYNVMYYILGCTNNFLSFNS